MLRPRHGDPGVSVQAPNEIVPTPLAYYSDDERRHQECRSQRERKPDAPMTLRGFLRLSLRAETRFQLRAKRLEGGRVPLKLGQFCAAQNVNAVDRVFETSAQVARRIAANDGCEVSMGSGRDPHALLVHSELIQRRVFLGLEHVTTE